MEAKSENDGAPRYVEAGFHRFPMFVNGDLPSGDSAVKNQNSDSRPIIYFCGPCILHNFECPEKKDHF